MWLEHSGTGLQGSSTPVQDQRVESSRVPESITPTPPSLTPIKQSLKFPPKPEVHRVLPLKVAVGQPVLVQGREWLIMPSLVPLFKNCIQKTDGTLWKLFCIQASAKQINPLSIQNPNYLHLQGLRQASLTTITIKTQQKHSWSISALQYVYAKTNNVLTDYSFKQSESAPTDSETLFCHCAKIKATEKQTQ